MAGETIDVAQVTEFSDRVHVAAQQSKARLRPYVMIQQIKGDVFAYDGLGQVEASEVVGRHQPVAFADALHLRRKIARRRFALTLPIDASDARGMLLSPESLYPGVCARAMERQFDRIVIEAMFAAVLTGREFATSVTYANDGGATIDATAGFNYERLQELNQKFIDDEVGVESKEQMVLGISGEEHQDLMNEVELVSGDYTREFAVEKGRLTNAAGFDLILYGGNVAVPMLSVASSVRTNFAMSTRAMCVGLSKEMSIKIEDRPDLIETKQVQIVFEMGAVRTEGKLIKKVTSTDRA